MDDEGRARAPALSFEARVRLVGSIVISFLVTVGFTLVMTLWMLRDRSQPNDLLNIMVGALTSNFTSVVQYWIGSSSRELGKGETR